MRTLLRRLLEGGTALLARVVVRLSPSGFASAKLLSYWVGARRVPDAAEVPPDSEQGRGALAFWFSLRDFTDRQINRACEAHYEGRHPKHFLWREHNRYLLDHVRPGDRVLDIGCGASAYPLWIAEKASEVLCVDVNPQRVAEARARRLRRSGTRPWTWRRSFHRAALTWRSAPTCLSTSTIPSACCVASRDARTGSS